MQELLCETIKTKGITSHGWSSEDAEKCVCLGGVSLPLLFLWQLAKLNTEHLAGRDAPSGYDSMALCLLNTLASCVHLHGGESPVIPQMEDSRIV